MSPAAAKAVNTSLFILPSLPENKTRRRDLAYGAGSLLERGGVCSTRPHAYMIAVSHPDCNRVVSRCTLMTANQRIMILGPRAPA